MAKASLVPTDDQLEAELQTDFYTAKNAARLKRNAFQSAAGVASVTNELELAALKAEESALEAKVELLLYKMGKLDFAIASAVEDKATLVLQANLASIQRELDHAQESLREKRKSKQLLAESQERAERRAEQEERGAKTLHMTDLDTGGAIKELVKGELAEMERRMIKRTEGRVSSMRLIEFQVTEDIKAKEQLFQEQGLLVLRDGTSVTREHLYVGAFTAVREFAAQLAIALQNAQDSKGISAQQAVCAAVDACITKNGATQSKEVRAFEVLRNEVASIVGDWDEGPHSTKPSMSTVLRYVQHLQSGSRPFRNSSTLKESGLQGFMTMVHTLSIAYLNQWGLDAPVRVRVVDTHAKQAEGFDCFPDHSFALSSTPGLHFSWAEVAFAEELKVDISGGESAASRGAFYKSGITQCCNYFRLLQQAGHRAAYTMRGDGFCIQIYKWIHDEYSKSRVSHFLRLSDAAAPHGFQEYIGLLLHNHQVDIREMPVDVLLPRCCDTQILRIVDRDEKAQVNAVYVNSADSANTKPRVGAASPAAPTAAAAAALPSPSTPSGPAPPAAPSNYQPLLVLKVYQKTEYVGTEGETLAKIRDCLSAAGNFRRRARALCAKLQQREATAAELLAASEAFFTADEVLFPAQHLTLLVGELGVEKRVLAAGPFGCTLQHHNLLCTGADSTPLPFHFSVFKQLLEVGPKVLAWLHRNGILHCDLNTSNILIVNGRFVINDFSHALLVAHGEGRGLHGTLGFASYHVSFCALNSISYNYNATDDKESLFLTAMSFAYEYDRWCKARLPWRDLRKQIKLMRGSFHDYRANIAQEVVANFAMDANTYAEVIKLLSSNKPLLCQKAKQAMKQGMETIPEE